MTLLEKDKAYIWHPFTQIKDENTPILIKKAQGTTLFAENGKQYIDAISSWWVNIHGHAHPHIAQAMAHQAMELEQVIFARFTHEPAINLAEQLLMNLPTHFSKVFFSDNGSTSVEVALKMALQFFHNQGITHKTKVISFENAYHGDTFGAMSVSGKSAFNTPFNPLLFEVFSIPIPDAHNIETIKNEFKKLINQGDIAAFIFEPLVQGAAGMQMYEAAYLDELIAIAQENNVVCIADEVMTGFGRTGELFAIDYLNNKPDIICLSKGITGGFMPLGVTCCSSTIYETFISEDISKTFFHGHSYTANPLACAAANASLELLLSENCQEAIEEIGFHHALFAEKLKGLAFVKNVRQTGTILAFEFNAGGASSYFNTIKDKAYNFFIDNGVLLRPLGNTVYLMPPYCITAKELNKVYTVILKSIDYLME
ncbi:MAG: adenosylmethionine--8-amino-7-oxononanoate transaminase [Saprospiraceae bacterium]|nr:adenosylmethionine--8-amino-7-oxononanoate transaminase [Saprospiraceae bacterium]